MKPGVLEATKGYPGFKDNRNKNIIGITEVKAGRYAVLAVESSDYIFQHKALTAGEKREKRKVPIIFFSAKCEG
jgi:hypothetical protein